MIRSLESGEVEDCAEKVFEDILAKNFPKIILKKNKVEEMWNCYKVIPTDQCTKERA